jgi:hypothetical protein
MIPEILPLLSKAVQSAISAMLLGNPNPRDVPIRILTTEAKKVPSTKPRQTVESIPKIIDVKINFLRLILLPMKLIVIEQRIIDPNNKLFPI